VPDTGPKTPSKAKSLAVESPSKVERFTVKPPMKSFFINDMQRDTINNLYEQDNVIERMNFSNTVLSQNQAQLFLQKHKLDNSSLENLESRWSVSWSNKWGSGNEQKKRILYQCTCGYNTEARKDRSSSKSRQWSRHAAYDFTGCCAHADITRIEATGIITRTIGFFNHNDTCKNGVMIRFPAIPLHEHVYVS